VSDPSGNQAPSADQIPTGWIRRPANNIAVIFVHGILSSATAWLNDNGSFWPLLLCDEPELSQIGVYLFNYRADAFSGTYSLQDAVDAMKEHFRLDGVISQHTLVFVCHSMGGIVARHFIVTQQALLIRQHTRIGLYLVASPSLGSEYANFIAKIGPLYNSQLDALRVGQTNAWLDTLDKTFINLKEDGSIPIYGKELIEDESIRVRGLFRRAQIVAPFSGARYFGDSIKIPFSNHLSIAKPSDRTALQHRILRQFLTKDMGGAQAEVSTSKDRDNGRDAKLSNSAVLPATNQILIAAPNAPRAPKKLVENGGSHTSITGVSRTVLIVGVLLVPVILLAIAPSEALKLLGFGTPFIYAVATYGAFHYLDRKASEDAKQTISSWFTPLEYGTADVSSAMIELFDGLYTKPLFGWRAMLRSSCISFLLLAFFTYEFIPVPITSIELFTVFGFCSFLRQMWF
jgi:pimeloyl-ACP methyl ester carboxylesterase